MSEKRYSLHDVTQSLRISPDTLYRWETQIPHLKPKHCDGARRYTGWEFDLVQHAHRLFHNYNQDFAGTRSALERWISKNPKPIPSNELDEEMEQKDVMTDEIKASAEPSDPDPYASLNSKRTSQVDLSTDQNSDDKENPLGDESDTHQSLANRPLNVAHDFNTENHDHHDPSPLSVIKQEGGKRRVIGRRDEDLFADLDSDPFDLSPSPIGRDYGFNNEKSLSSAGDLVPSLLDMERKHSLSESTSQAKQSLRQTQPSNSDWLERSTAVDEQPVSERSSGLNHSSLLGQKQTQVSTYRAQNFKPKSAFSSPEIKVEQMVDSPISKPALSSPQKEEQAVQQPESESIEPFSKKGKYQGAPLTPIPVKKTIKSPYGAKSKPISNYSKNNTASYPAVSSTPLISSNERTMRRNEDGRDLKASELNSSKSKTEFDAEDTESWQRAYNNSQAQLARTKGELARSQEQLELQNKEIKQLKHQFYSIRESILKEIYDLKDLVVDK
ncbi:MAG: hypothetical protein CMH49_03905 [Myxococcales bacterium]|nr:hypothetical protein [Myxococcales bacterium]